MFAPPTGPPSRAPTAAVRSAGQSTGESACRQASACLCWPPHPQLPAETKRELQAQQWVAS
eukprot:1159840-Pelagomonas_calceolata.AAC.12